MATKDAPAGIPTGEYGPVLTQEIIDAKDKLLELWPEARAMIERGEVGFRVLAKYTAPASSDDKLSPPAVESEKELRKVIDAYTEWVAVWTAHKYALGALWQAKKEAHVVAGQEGTINKPVTGLRTVLRKVSEESFGTELDNYLNPKKKGKK